MRLLLALALTLLAAPALADAPPAGAIRVITYNIHQGQGVETPSIGPVNLPVARPGTVKRIADQLNALGADIIMLQEVDKRAAGTGWHDQTARLADRLGMHLASGVAHEDAWGLWKIQANVVLSRHPIIATRVVEVSGAGDEEERRVAVIAHIDHPSIRGGVWAVATHLAAHDARRRVAGARLLAQVVSGLPGAVVVGGDFNDGPDSEALKVFKSTLATAGKPMTDAFASHGTGPAETSSVTRPKRTIDYLFTSGELPAIAARVPREIRLSDHYPVVADLAAH